jgi:selenide,water dikinase
MLASTTKLNSVGAMLGQQGAVHAITDVTGFGLLGHGLEMARGSGVTLRINAASVPLLTQARALVDQDFVTGASHRNWDSCLQGVANPDAIPTLVRHLLTDAQTSGGLLISCEAAAAGGILAMIREQGYPRAAIIGSVEAGDGRLIVDVDQ